jgi:hypothetical protein
MFSRIIRHEALTLKTQLFTVFRLRHMNKKIYLLALVTSLIIPNVFAQGQLPTANDLKAAYCTPIVVNAIRVAERYESDLKSLTKLTNVQTQMLEFLQQKRELKNRLDSYLRPRIFYLEITGMLSAEQRGEEDVASISSGGIEKFKSCLNKCSTKEKSGGVPRDCTEECTATPLRERIRSCDKLDWLP